MNEIASSQKVSSWTWADQISTYRFWGIILFYVFSIIAHWYAFNTYSYFFLIEIKGIEDSQMGLIRSMGGFSILPGFFLAWIATQTRNHYMLILFGCLQIIGLSIIIFSNNIIFMYTGSALLEIGSWAIMLAVPAILAGGRGGAGMYIVVYGIIILIESNLGMATIAPLGYLVQVGLTPLMFLSMTGGIVLLGMLFLIPVKSTLFNDAPPSRGYSLTPEIRNPLAVALLCFIPFFGIYLLYRFHGETAFFSSSNKLLSPGPAAASGIFIPFIIPAMAVSLAEQLNKAALKQEQIKQLPRWGIILWSILFAPVSFALIQSRLNALIKANLQNTHNH